ncbi:penicillin-binding protein 1C [Mesorhizobium sp. M0913]|uniref:penicillin-binding protein 1C n=1 Tax=Mesorhizobium sp. M0913 TaxID=2957026 RepID=UPI003336D6CA
MKGLRGIAALFAHGVLAALCLLATLEISVRFADVPGMERLEANARLVYAADGGILSGFLAPDEKWRFATGAETVDPKYLQMLVAYEDRNFWHHHGVDGFAVMRAAGQALSHRRVVSGASTLTMQLVRLLDPKPRGTEAKLLEIVRALKIERMMSKKDIFNAYISRAPFGGNVEGVRAASLIYFGKEPSLLTLGEAALLVALPQSPESRRPDRAPDEARAARDRILKSLAGRHVIAEEEATVEVRRPLQIRIAGIPKIAPHLALRLKVRAAEDDRPILTVLDKGLQSKAEEIAASALDRWEAGVNIAIFVIRNEDGAVIGYVGSGDPGSRSRDGYVDLIRAVRSPGSALKPLIFAMAFEELIVHPDTIVADQPIDIAGYRPENADGVFAGDLLIRQALILSKNTVPVLLLDRIGVDAFLSRFRTVGWPLQLSVSDSQAGLAVALGGAGVSLEQLTWLYSAFANEGELRQLRYAPTDATTSLGQLISPEAANAVADILADVPPPVGRSRLVAQDGTRRIGFKTGTSYGFRDAWAVGFDKLHTVGVWIGRPDGAPHLGAYGVSAAAPVMMQVFDVLPLPASGAGSGHTPPGALASPRNLPERLKRFGPATGSAPFQLPTITFPKQGAQIAAERLGGSAALCLKVSGGHPPYRWTVLGKEAEPQASQEFWATIATRGEIKIGVTDADGKVDQSSFWFE